MAPKFWIVLVNYNGLEDTRQCLRTIADLPGDVATVVVDNASVEDPSATLAREFPWCPVVRNRVNGGWAGGNNTGIVYALQRGAEQVLLLNNDTTVSPQLVSSLLAAAERCPDYGILGPVINFMDEPDDVMTDGCVFNRPEEPGFFQRKAVPLTAGQPAAVTEVDIVNGCAMMIRSAVFRRIGLIDERFFLIHEESDFCLRAREAGFRCGVLGETLVWHKGSSSFKRTGKQMQRYFDARNLYLLLHKHAGPSRQMRGPWQTRQTYLKYVYWRYSIERENGQPDAADAVLRGVLDAVTGRFGPQPRQPQVGLGMLRGLFELVRRRRAAGKR